MEKLGSNDNGNPAPHKTWEWSQKDMAQKEIQFYKIIRTGGSETSKNRNILAKEQLANKFSFDGAFGLVLSFCKISHFKIDFECKFDPRRANAMWGIHRNTTKTMPITKWFNHFSQEFRTRRKHECFLHVPSSHLYKTKQRFVTRDNWGKQVSKTEWQNDKWEYAFPIHLTLVLEFFQLEEKQKRNGRKVFTIVTITNSKHFEEEISTSPQVYVLTKHKT